MSSPGPEKLVLVSFGVFGDVLDYPKTLSFLSSVMQCFYFGIGDELPNDSSIRIVNAATTDRWPKRLFFMFFAWRFIKRVNPDHVVVSYFPGCSVLAFVLPNPVLDLRTGYISTSRIRTWCMNLLTLLEAKCFRRVMVISDGVRRNLHISKAKSEIVPVGCDQPTFSPKERGADLDFIFVYVGTFFNRRIPQMIAAFSEFVKAKKSSFSQMRPKLVIIGASDSRDVDECLGIAAELGSSDYVDILFRLDHRELEPFFRMASVGVAYIPELWCYQFQPPTKILEYMSYGLPTLATATSANKDLIDKFNGVIADDSIEGFSRGFAKIYSNAQTFDSLLIRRRSEAMSWESLALKKILPFLRGRSCDN